MPIDIYTIRKYLSNKLVRNKANRIFIILLKDIDYILEYTPELESN